jgi:hypothetical protein
MMACSSDATCNDWSMPLTLCPREALLNGLSEMTAGILRPICYDHLP